MKSNKNIIHLPVLFFTDPTGTICLTGQRCDDWLSMLQNMGGQCCDLIPDKNVTISDSVYKKV